MKGSYQAGDSIFESAFLLTLRTSTMFPTPNLFGHLEGDVERFEMPSKT